VFSFKWAASAANGSFVFARFVYGFVEPAAALHEQLLPALCDGSRAVDRPGLRLESAAVPREHGVDRLGSLQPCAYGVVDLAFGEVQRGLICAVREAQHASETGQRVHLHDVGKRHQPDGAREARARSQGAVQGLEQGVERVGLLEVLDRRALPDLRAHFRRAVGRHDHRGDARRHGARLDEQLETAHARHADVGHKRVRRCSLDAAQRLVRVGEALEGLIRASGL
jgi:hypothetical protein